MTNGDRLAAHEGDWLEEIEAQADDSSPYYLPRLIAEIRALRARIEELEQALNHVVYRGDKARQERELAEAALHALQQEQEGLH